MDLTTLALYWQHPLGDPTTLPCTHLKFQHPAGDSAVVPCVHGLTQAHPSGDPLTTPCLHMVPAHAGGHHETVPCVHGLTQAHPGGDRVGFLVLPCIHISLVHPEGDTIDLPCLHLVPQHPGGDVTLVPCVHVSLVHPQGDTVTVPCTHVQQEHPQGDPGPTLPCTHGLPVVRAEYGGRLLFYTDDPQIQEWYIAIVRGLTELGVDVLSPRPLHVFNRQPINGNPGDSSDPFWSHYNPLYHSIQLMGGRAPVDNLDTAEHEAGHAILGHSIPNHFAGGPHSGSTPNANPDGSPNLTLAMSEGWAQFVGMALENRLELGSARFQLDVWENLTLTPDPATDNCVGAALWDLYDPTGREKDGPDRVSLPFTEMFRVYSPTLQTLLDGPQVVSIYDYCTRVRENNPRNRGLGVRMDEILARNVGAPA